MEGLSRSLSGQYASALFFVMIVLLISAAIGFAPMLSDGPASIKTVHVERSPIVADETPVSKLVENPLWATYPGKEGIRNGKHIVLIAAEQEYRSQEAMPMLAKILSQHHGFDCTVLFLMNMQNEVDPKAMDNIKVDGKPKYVEGHIPGLENLKTADLMIKFTRFMRLPEKDMKHFTDYLDAGKPLLAIRTANHGFKGRIPYKWNKEDKFRFGIHVLGSTFAGHYGGWHREATRGIVIEEQKEHPILRGVKDIFGPSDVYKMNPTPPYGDTVALVNGQPLTGLKPTDPPNTKKPPIPIAWVKTWTGNTGKTSRIFHTTIGSARDQLSDGVRRMIVNASFWCLHMEDKITPELDISFVDPFNPTKSGFEAKNRQTSKVDDYRLK